jgi:hypothetical protein
MTARAVANDVRARDATARLPQPRPLPPRHRDMRLRSLGPLTVAVGLLAVAPAARAANGCDHHHLYTTTQTTGHGTQTQRHTYETVLNTDQVRVFRQRGFVNVAYFLCARRNGHLHRIGVVSGESAAASDIVLTDMVAVGPILGYDTQTRGDVNQDRFRAIDAVNGRTVTDSGNVVNQPGAPDPEFAMARSGDLGWIVAGIAGVADARGPRTVSDPAAGPASALAIGDNTAYFTQAGAAHTTPLF